jgi:hypothetical protein
MREFAFFFITLGDGVPSYSDFLPFDSTPLVDNRPLLAAS